MTAAPLHERPGEFPSTVLTLHRPWPFAIFHLPPLLRKPVENRSWKPPPSLIGQRLAIHAGKFFDEESLEGLMDLVGDAVDWSDPAVQAAVHETGIVGSVLVHGWVKALPAQTAVPQFGGCTLPEALGVLQSDYFSGPIGWLLWHARRLRQGVAIPGNQGLWRLPEGHHQLCIERAGAIL